MDGNERIEDINMLDPRCTCIPAHTQACACNANRSIYTICTCNPVHSEDCAVFEIPLETIKEVATRVDRAIRYDILDPLFLEYMAKVADYGAKKYGDFNWHKSRLTGDKSPVNHMYKHLGSYQKNEPYDHPELGEGPEWHLIGLAFNAMMEFFYVTKDIK